MAREYVDRTARTVHAGLPSTPHLEGYSLLLYKIPLQTGLVLQNRSQQIVLDQQSRYLFLDPIYINNMQHVCNIIIVFVICAFSYKTACVPSEGSDQPAHPSSLISLLRALCG